MAIEDALLYIKEIEIKDCDIDFCSKEKEEYNKVFDMINNLNGNELKVSDFIPYKDGSYILGTTSHEKRGIAENVPVWKKDKCIQCNQCAFVCPHAVIRPYLLNDEEVKNAPQCVKDNLRNAIGSKYQYTMGISKLDCTGCSLCQRVCPSNAIEMKPFEDVSNNDGFKYLQSVSKKSEQINNTVKGTQFSKPLFEFSGACAGCGETPYIKLLTQLFGNKIAIANATGCSSIYGASFPSIPYNIPWANSLFEDNAEFGYGFRSSIDKQKDLAVELLKKLASEVGEELVERILNKLDQSDEKSINEQRCNLNELQNRLMTLENYQAKHLATVAHNLLVKSVWIVGGDGWAYLAIAIRCACPSEMP